MILAFGIKSLPISALNVTVSESESPRVIVPPSAVILPFAWIFPWTFKLPPITALLATPTPPAIVKAPVVLLVEFTVEVNATLALAVTLDDKTVFVPASVVFPAILTLDDVTVSYTHLTLPTIYSV